MSTAPIDVSELTEAQATLLMPLWARAMESESDQPVLRDAAAQAIVSQLDFDFSLFERKSVPIVDYCLRASVFDQVTQRFVDKNPTGAVVELGVGLDTRFDRLNNDRTTWTELDLPAVMSVRRKFFESTRQRAMIAASLLDDDWIDRVAERVDGKPTLFVVEGVLYFFKKSQVRGLFQKLANRFPRCGLVFDAQSPFFLKVSNLRHPLKDSSLQFSLGNPRAIENWDPRFQVRQFVGFGDSPYYDNGMRRMPLYKRWGRRLLPFLRNLFKVVELGW